MKILITGSNGQLGNELIRILKEGRSEIGKISDSYKNAEITAIDVDVLDITDIKAVSFFVTENKSDLIINCAAMTNVDACESDFNTAMKVNSIGAGNMALAADKVGAKIIHVSTDYVFDGSSNNPYIEWDIPYPNTIYGKSKLLGEKYVKENTKKAFIVRTSWLYGYIGNNFVKTMINLAKEKDSIKVVHDQVGNPTNANDLAHHILKIGETDNYGIYHCTGKGICSWHDFAREIIRLSSFDCEVKPCTTEEFPRPAPRPAYSAMENLMLKCTMEDEMRDWKEALQTYMKKIKYV